MSHSLITTQAGFDDLCDHIAGVSEVAFDTEFVSEFTYRPELCLLQFATRERCAAVDPFAVPDLSRWWSLMTRPDLQVVVHGGREEVRFCLRHAEQPPTNLIDVQVAEGLLSRSFPLSHAALVLRVIGRRTHGKETRTDWRRRPLTDRQIVYAVEDVEHLLDVWQAQRERLQARGRLSWAQAEFQRLIAELVHERTREGWRRLPGIQSLSPRELAVIRELHAWREQEAEAKDKPARKVLRDDLLVELARRQPRDVADLLATRDLNRPEYRRAADQMLAAIAAAQALPAADCPTIKKSEKDQDEQIVAQLLAIALANRCAQAEVSVGMVGTSADLRHLVRWHVNGDRSDGPPRLTEGWRAEVCGELLSDVLDGRVGIRVSDPESDHPLSFFPIASGAD